VLGKGGFCSVRKALHELTGQPVACKIIEKSKLKVCADDDAEAEAGGRLHWNACMSVCVPVGRVDAFACVEYGEAAAWQQCLRPRLPPSAEHYHHHQLK
jgi:serine/threonine protein kinase